MGEPKPPGERPLAFVTGASSGIGAAFARELAARGFDLIVVARRRGRLEALAAELPGAEVEILALDLADPVALERARARVAAEPRLALLVNDAGGMTRGPFEAADPDGEAELVRVHALAPVVLTRAGVEAMAARGTGAVIQVASRAAFAPNEDLPTYAAVKAFLHRHAVAIAPSLARRGVRVLSLCPGNTRTELFENAGFPREEVARMAAMEPADVVRAALDALDAGSVVCVPGERALVRGLRRLVPRRLAARAAAVLERISLG